MPVTNQWQPVLESSSAAAQPSLLQRMSPIHVGALAVIAVVLMIVVASGPTPSRDAGVSALPALGGGGIDGPKIDVVGQQVSENVAHGAMPSPAAGKQLLVEGGGKSPAKSVSSPKVDGGGVGEAASAPVGVAPIAASPDVNASSARPALSVEAQPF